MELTGIWIRVLLITFASNLFCVKFMGTLLGWKRSIYYVMTGLEAKVLFCNIFLYYFFLPCYGKEVWGKTIYGLLYFLTTVLVLLLYYQTFRGSLLKIGIVGIWSELFCVPATYTCIAVLNFLEHRQNLLTVEAEIQPADFLILPIIWGYFRLLKVFSRRWHYQIRKWEPKNRKILWTFYGIYMFLAVSSSYEINVFTTPVISFAAVLITTIFILGVLFLSRKYQRQVFARKEFLDMEQKMMREHYRMITVLDFLLKECLRQPEGTERRLVLKAEDLKNQVMIVCLYNWKIRRRKMKNLLRPFVTMYEGNVEWKTDKENTGFIIRVSGENIK